MTEAYQHAKSIVSLLARAGFTAYFAGGWVRDFVMGHPSEDIDIATDASPPEIMDLFPQTILVGLAFGVVIVVLEGHQFEVATFRKDLQYLDGRHPKGIEMSTPREDALRRDFTINGMFYDPLEEKIHDFVHGQEDIRLGVIRTIGDPHERFFEDRLRMLRAFRFSSRFSFTIDPDTQEAIRENAHKLFPAVAMERVWQEFNKMAAYPRFDQAIVDMHRLALLDVIFPEIEGMHINDLRYSVNHYSSFPPGCPTILYLMEFLNVLPFEQRVEIARRLKVPNRDIKLMEYVEQLSQAAVQGLDNKQKWSYLFANPDWEVGIQVLAVRFSAELIERIRALHKELEPHIQRIKIGKPLVSASFLQSKGILPGIRMGQLMKEGEKIAIHDNLSTPEEVLAKLQSLPLWEEK
jgi:poly(A) polymerase